MKKINPIILISILLFTLVACNEKTEEEKAKAIVEDILKTSTGNDVDIEVDEDGEAAKVTIKGANGEEIISTTGKTKLPDDFPTDVHIIDGKITGITVTVIKKQIVTIVIETDGKISDVKNEIEKKMEADGWKAGSNMNIPDAAMLNYSKDERGVTITIGKEDDKTVASYMVSY